MTFQLELELLSRQVMFALLPVLPYRETHRQALSQESSKQCQSCSLSNSPSGKLIPTNSAESHSDTALLITCLTPRTEMGCDSVYVCVFKRDWHSILRLLKYFLCLACKPKRGRKHKTSTYTRAPCIKSMSVQSRRGLRLPPLGLQKCGGGAGCVCGREHLGISFYKFTV